MRQDITAALDLHEEGRKALAAGDLERVRQVRGAIVLRAQAIGEVRDAMDRELSLDPASARRGFSADGAARVIGAYEDALRGDS